MQLVRGGLIESAVRFNDFSGSGPDHPGTENGDLRGCFGCVMAAFLSLRSQLSHVSNPTDNKNLSEDSFALTVENPL
jgi:hypothetical protein